MTRVTTLGCCPNCGRAITRDYLLIEYESDGCPAKFAECPDCRDVVHPSAE
ncbi:hypothetical protein NGM10_03555 [Halorussus salilacus]|uniref:DUF7837 family putative zinc-binding protein n=1 Tax=Halorussus salilacus TaxID=2953750 RepID=UPI00209F8B41|nr:hypothetical protein [Halorussus salilacus]USZ68817.1 hypothetical protein NGM10_03555 [Halorussus salilacus]